MSRSSGWAGLAAIVDRARRHRHAALSTAQRGRGGPAGPPPTPRAGAPIDFTGTWVSVVTEDWRWRMVTPPKGDVASVPVNGEGRKATAAWDLNADNAAGNQCKAFGVGGIMRQPGRLRISWQDDSTLKLEFDAGTQTRLLNFDRTKQPGAEKTWQGFSLAVWEGPGFGRVAEAPPGPGGGPAGPAVPWRRRARPARRSAASRAGVDRARRRRQGRDDELPRGLSAEERRALQRERDHHRVLPPAADASQRRQLAERRHRRRGSAISDGAYYTSTNFRLEPDDTKFAPTPCQTVAPLPVKTK